MNHKGLRRFALALLSCLACPVAAHALTCPPGQIEVNGRCIPLQPHSYDRKFTAPVETGVRPQIEVIRPEAESRSAPPSVEGKANQPLHETRTQSPPPPPIAASPPAPPASPSAADIERAVR
jgi:hypothetical protein